VLGGPLRAGQSAAAATDDDEVVIHSHIPP
jgi:hypothetical protein